MHTHIVYTYIATFQIESQSPELILVRYFLSLSLACNVPQCPTHYYIATAILISTTLVHISQKFGKETYGPFPGANFFFIFTFGVSLSAILHHKSVRKCNKNSLSPSFVSMLLL